MDDLTNYAQVMMHVYWKQLLYFEGCLPPHHSKTYSADHCFVTYPKMDYSPCMDSMMTIIYSTNMMIKSDKTLVNDGVLGGGEGENVDIPYFGRRDLSDLLRMGYWEQ